MSYPWNGDRDHKAQFDEVVKQRDDLLAALRRIVTAHRCRFEGFAHGDERGALWAAEVARAAIAKAVQS